MEFCGSPHAVRAFGFGIWDLGLIVWQNSNPKSKIGIRRYCVRHQKYAVPAELLIIVRDFNL
jgi:hypothetical protein